jgi:6-pyruvoyl-tetrahydropterin synthase
MWTIHWVKWTGNLDFYNFKINCEQSFLQFFDIGKMTKNSNQFTLENTFLQNIHNFFIKKLKKFVEKHLLIIKPYDFF